MLPRNSLVRRRRCLTEKGVADGLDGRVESPAIESRVRHVNVVGVVVWTEQAIFWFSRSTTTTGKTRGSCVYADHVLVITL